MNSSGTMYLRETLNPVRISQFLRKIEPKKNTKKRLAIGAYCSMAAVMFTAMFGVHLVLMFASAAAAGYYSSVLLTKHTGVKSWFFAPLFLATTVTWYLPVLGLFAGFFALGVTRRHPHSIMFREVLRLSSLCCIGLSMIYMLARIVLTAMA